MKNILFLVLIILLFGFNCALFRLLNNYLIADIYIVDYFLKEVVFKLFIDYCSIQSVTRMLAVVFLEELNKIFFRYHHFINCSSVIRN